jgi:two-component system sensor histidine kinase DevS
VKGQQDGEVREAAGPADLAACREQVAQLHQELEETNRGLIALHAELEAARQAEAELAAIVHASEDAMFSMTPDGVIRTWNRGAERLFGYQAGEIVGQRGDVLVPSGLGEDLAAAVKRLRAGERAAGYDSRRRRKDGSLVDVAVTLSAMRGPAGELTGFAAVLRDVTERLRTETELAGARAQQEVLAERDRMARDLHDSVIQRLFAAGMALQGTAGLRGGAEVAARIDAVVQELDISIREIREAIFTLRSGPRAPASLRAQVLGLASGAEHTLGFAPAVSFDGAIGKVPADVTAQAVAVIREALSNIARHAGASAAEITLSAGADLLLAVSDNGRGLGPAGRSSGLRNMRERAQLLGGSFEVISEPGAGTRLHWRVPLSR